MNIANYLDVVESFDADLDLYSDEKLKELKEAYVNSIKLIDEILEERNK